LIRECLPAGPRQSSAWNHFHEKSAGDRSGSSRSSNCRCSNSGLLTGATAIVDPTIHPSSTPESQSHPVKSATLRAEVSVINIDDRLQRQTTQCFSWPSTPDSLSILAPIDLHRFSKVRRGCLRPEPVGRPPYVHMWPDSCQPGSLGCSCYHFDHQCDSPDLASHRNAGFGSCRL